MRPRADEVQKLWGVSYRLLIVALWLSNRVGSRSWVVGKLRMRRLQPGDTAKDGSVCVSEGVLGLQVVHTAVQAE